MNKDIIIIIINKIRKKTIIYKVIYIFIIGRQPGMAVRMPTPINQLFNDESIAVQIIFLDDYTWN